MVTVYVSKVWVPKLILVADATPRIGVTNVGDVVRLIAPVPLTFVASAVAIPVPNPLTPVDIGSPVQLVKVPEVGVPRIGVTNVGEVVNDIAPLPLTLAASAVATPVPYPVVPDIGNPVQLVNTPDAGVPRAGVTKVGDVDPAKLPVPV